MSTLESKKTIQISRLRWAILVLGLRKRGAGRRESGAFLMGHWDGDHGIIAHHVYYDDIDPMAYQGGAIEFHAGGFSKLWELCKQTGMEVLADVHTHPGDNVRQSSIDQRHPMLPVVGHTAIILPRFAHTGWWSARGAGVYEYQGNFKWLIHPAIGKNARLALTLW